MQVSQKLVNGKYRKIAVLGEGSGGKVYLVQNLTPPSNVQDQNQNTTNPNIEQPNKEQKPDRSFYALKKFKGYNKPESSTSPSEIEIVQMLDHPNIMKFIEVFTVDKGYKQNTYAVLPYCIEVTDLFEFKQVSLTQLQLKQIIYQIVLAVEYLHSKQIIHRDIKPSNILINSKGGIELADFDIATKVKPQMTKNMVTRYYRAPEIMYGSNDYSFEVDIWSLGCTIAELILESPLFPGQTDIDQLDKIYSVMGSPLKTWHEAVNYPYFMDFDVEQPKGLQNIIPTQDQDLFDLIKKMIVLNPKERSTIKEIIQHQYFKDVNTDTEQLSKLSDYVKSKKLKQIFEKIEKTNQQSKEDDDGW